MHDDNQCSLPDEGTCSEPICVVSFYLIARYDLLNNWGLGLRCLHISIFIETPSLEGLPTKAKEDPSPHKMRLSPAGHQPSVSWSFIIIIIIIIIIILLILLLRFLLFFYFCYNWCYFILDAFNFYCSSFYHSGLYLCTNEIFLDFKLWHGQALFIFCNRDTKTISMMQF